jgi:phage FluMu protein Com
MMLPAVDTSAHYAMPTLAVTDGIRCPTPGCGAKKLAHALIGAVCIQCPRCKVHHTFIQEGRYVQPVIERAYVITATLT